MNALQKCADMYRNNKSQPFSGPSYGVLAGEPEIIGERCADGGTCHHLCTDSCFRKECCSPLSGSGLNDNWCVCTMSQRVLGDGCYICNPEKAEELLEGDA